MYGKHFESMYTGSMVGSGVTVFAVWGYVIAKARDSHVELNPKLLAMVLGGNELDIERAIQYLCSPDEHSRSSEEDGRRLIREGQFMYKVVNHSKYRAIQSEEGLREYNRIKQQESRKKRKLSNIDVNDGQ